MINNGFIYKYLLDLANKDDRGNVFSPSEFNRILEEANLSKYNIEYGKYQEDQDNTDAMAVFTVLDSPLTLTGGSTALPASYNHFINASYNDGTKDRQIDEVPTMEKNNR